MIDENFITLKKGNEEYKVKYYSDIFNVDPVLALAIEYQESTSGGVHYASRAYVECNNPAGLMNPSNTSKIWEFKSPDAGIIEHIHQLKTNYLDKGYKTPEQIKQKYSPDGALNDPNGLNAHWISGVRIFMNEIRNNENIFDNKDIEESVKFSK